MGRHPKGNLLSGLMTLKGGLAFWTLVSLALIYFRGLVYDESIESAQIILGQIQYPSGHPNHYHLSALNIGNYVTAALLWLSGNNIELVCGFRNVLGITSVLLPFFYLLYVLSHRAEWAHLGTLLLASGVIAPISNFVNYPTGGLLSSFSHGSIGLGVTMLILALSIAKNWKAMWILVGFMPVIHLGFLPLIFVWLVLSYWDPALKPGNRGQVLRWISYGLITSVCLFALIRWRVSLEPEALGTYGLRETPWMLWNEFVFHLDHHRFGPWKKSWIPFFGMAVFGFGAVWAFQKTFKKDPRWRQLFYFGFSGMLLFILAAIPANLLKWSFLKGTLPEALQFAPYLFLSWIPYRYDGVVFLLAVVFAFVVIARMMEEDGARWKAPILGSVGVLFCVSSLKVFFHHDIEGHINYFLLGIPFGLCFGAMLDGLRAYPRERKIYLCILAGYALVFFAAVFYFMRSGQHGMGSPFPRYMMSNFISAGMAFMACRLVQGRQWGLLRWGLAPFVALVVVLYLLETPLAARRLIGGKYLLDPIQRQSVLKEQMATILPGSGMILVPPEKSDRFLGHRLRRATLMTSDTPWTASYAAWYMPVLERMIREVFGGDLKSGIGDYRRLWVGRSKHEWEALAKKYQFEGVFSRVELPALSPSIVTQKYYFYKIP